MKERIPGFRAPPPSFYPSVLSPHPSPFCHTVRERLSLAMTVRSPGSGDPATRPRAFPGTTHQGQRGSSRPPSQVPSLPRKGTPFRLAKKARQNARQGFTHCARESRTKKDLHFRTTVRRRCPKSGFLGKRVSTCLLNQEPSDAIRCKPIKAQALSVSARTKGLTCIASVRAKGSLLMRKKKSSGPYILGTFKKQDDVRKRTTSHRSK